MTLNVYERIYSNLKKLTNDLTLFMNKSGYLKLTQVGYMPLIVEKISPDQISIAHYYEQNGDLCQDPEITLRVDLINKTAEALTYQDSFQFNEVYPGENKINLRYKKELNMFLNQWLILLKKQGFYK